MTAHTPFVTSTMFSFRMLCCWLFATLAFIQPLSAQTAKPATGKWAPREVGDLQLDAPFALADSPEMASGLPQNVKDALADIKAAVGGDDDTITIIIAAFTYKPGVSVTLDGATKGTVGGVAKSIGDSDPQYKVETIKLSGLDARKVSYQKDMATGRPVRLELLMAQRGQTLWQVQVISFTKEITPDMSKVLNSVAIKAVP